MIDQSPFDQLSKHADDVGLVFGSEGQVRIIPVAKDTKAAERSTLGVNPFSGKNLGTGPDFGGLEALGFFNDLEFDRQSVAVPTGNIGALVAGHRLALNHEILENLVQGSSHMHIAVGERRSVVQDETIRVGFFALRNDLLVKLAVFPFFEAGRLAFHQISTHRKFGFGQIQRGFVAGRTVLRTHSYSGSKGRRK